MESIQPKKVNIGAFMKEPQTITFMKEEIVIPIYGVDKIGLFAPVFEEDITSSERITKMAELGKQLLKDIIDISDEELRKVPFPVILNFASKVIEVNGFTTGEGDSKKLGSPTIKSGV